MGKTRDLFKSHLGSWKLMVARVRDGIVREIGMDVHTPLYLKWITSKDLLFSVGILINVTWQPGWEGHFGENGYVHMCGWVPLLSTRNYHNSVNQLYSNTHTHTKLLFVCVCVFKCHLGSHTCESLLGLSFTYIQPPVHQQVQPGLPQAASLNATPPHLLRYQYPSSCRTFSRPPREPPNGPLPGRPWLHYHCQSVPRIQNASPWWEATSPLAWLDALRGRPSQPAALPRGPAHRHPSVCQPQHTRPRSGASHSPLPTFYSEFVHDRHKTLNFSNQSAQKFSFQTLCLQPQSLNSVLSPSFTVRLTSWKVHIAFILILFSHLKKNVSLRQKVLSGFTTTIFPLPWIASDTN